MSLKTFFCSLLIGSSMPLDSPKTAWQRMWGVAKSSRAEIMEMLHRKSATYQNAAIRFMLLRLLLQSRYLPLAGMNASTVIKSATESVWETVYVCGISASALRKFLFNEFFLSSFLSKRRKCLLQGITKDFTNLVLELSAHLFKGKPSKGINFS